MAYKVLYRKYRPMTFSDVVGQPQVTVTLKNELIAGRIAHAYLFTGSRGTGKTTCARILAKAVNCLNPKDGDPCGECEVCRGIESGSVMDISEIDAASNNGIDSIRSLIEETAFTPGTAKYRVYIIDEVHELSDNAFNALLKTLEEPPPHVIFILATTEVHELLPTILSRCQRFDFKRITPDDIADRLEYICSMENVEIEREAGLLIARIADGGMRDAISILDQCIGRGNKITVQTVNETAGIAGREHLFSLADFIKARDTSGALEIINQLHHNSKDMNKLCEEIAAHLRQLMLIKTMNRPESLMTVTKSEMEQLTEQASSFSLATIIHGMDTLQRTLDKMKFSNPRVELEMAFIRLCSPELDSTPEALIRRIEALEQGSPSTRLLPPERVVEVEQASAAASPAPPPRPLQTSSAEPAKSMDGLIKDAKIFNEWPEVLQIMKKYSQSIAAAFGGSSAYISGGFMLINGSQFAFDLLKNSTQRERLKDAIFAVTGKSFKLGPYKAVEGQTEDKSDPLAALEERANEAGIEITAID